MQKKTKFESEVHLGLLAIIFFLLVLNFISNFIIFRARESKRQMVLDRFETAALVISRAASDVSPPALSSLEYQEFLKTFGLSDINIVATGPGDDSRETRRRWFTSIARSIPPDRVHEFARRLIEADYEQLTRGVEGEYFYVHQVAERDGENLLVLSAFHPDLAQLDDHQQLAMILGLIALLAIAGVYVLLSRRIVSPFRRIRDQAMVAGRKLEGEDQVEAVVREYRNIIGELEEKERLLRRANAEIQQRADSLEEFNRYLLMSMRVGVMTVDEDGRVVTVNEAARRMIGRDESECAGRHHSEVLDSHGAVAEVLRRLLDDKDPTEYQEVSLPGPDGSEIIMGVSSSPVYDADHRVIGGSVLLNDVTEINRLRSDLETSRRLAALGEMSGGLAHQLRNSMGAISGYLTLASKRLSRRGVEEPSFDELAREAGHADDLVRRFLQFARPLTCMPESVNLGTLIEDCIRTVSGRQEHAAAEFISEVPTDLTVAADPLLLRQALGNLLDNAAGALGDEPGVVTVVITDDGDTISLEVRDTGRGIPSENMDKIFTPFFSSRPSGTGLGLPLARKIIELHGGRIGVRSTPGAGTTFAVKLPLTQPGADDPSPTSRRTPSRA